ncbi:tetratricopeptide repeat protein [Cognatishimia activa]|uniref:tetratricopeptide repeat protein n=1 Tax=Cognatishimia activa TaxID=1715691 RepID=UPI00222E8E12|nr:hypothetical protein [Cognatishimia activa]UZD91732.1 hypothetical protein M0D42_03700 [Cognatishimia activa]
MRALIPFLFMASPLMAECPEAPDHTAALDAIFAEIQTATTQTQGLTIGVRLWEYWTDAPDEIAQKILDRGMNRRSGFDFFGARSDFDRLVEYCPDFAEGYNQRAFVNYLSNDFEAALPDLDRAIELSPRHVGALSGRALTLMALGRDFEAQRDLRAALELNPWLPERSYLLPLGEEL